jgi:hypothetical protein
MKTLKIVVVVTLAAIAVASLTASTYAYMGGQTRVSNTVPAGAFYGIGSCGMIGGPGYCYSAPTAQTPQSSGTPSLPPAIQYSGGWGCRGMKGNFGYSAP